MSICSKNCNKFQKILRAWDEQHWMKPIVSEDTIHELTTVKLMYKIDMSSREETREETREEILKLIGQNSKITQKELSKAICVSPKGIEWQIKQLKNEGILERIGSTKGGHWEMKND